MAHLARRMKECHTLALLAANQLREETRKPERRAKESLAGHLRDVVPLIETGGQPENFSREARFLGIFNIVMTICRKD